MKRPVSDGTGNFFNNFCELRVRTSSYVYPLNSRSHFQHEEALRNLKGRQNVVTTDNVKSFKPNTVSPESYINNRTGWIPAFRRQILQGLNRKRGSHGGITGEENTDKYISFSDAYNNTSTRLVFYCIVLNHFKSVRGNISDSTISVCEPLLLISRSVRIGSEVSTFPFLLAR